MQAEGKIYTLDDYLNYWPPDWWQARLGQVFYSTVAPGVVVLSSHPVYQDIPVDTNFDLDNGIRIRSARLRWTSSQELQATLYWEARQPVTLDYSVAVHLLAQLSPQSPADVLAQADAIHPVRGWYPTSQWQPGVVVRDDYHLQIPPGTTAIAVQIGMYRLDENGHFLNSEWLSLDLP